MMHVKWKIVGVLLLALAVTANAIFIGIQDTATDTVEGDTGIENPAVHTPTPSQTVTGFGNGFSDDMVLQRGPSVATVYGPLGSATELIVLVFRTLSDGSKFDYSVRAVVNLAESSWRARLEPAGDGTADIVLLSPTEGPLDTLRRVAFGDVWFCSGQSNMALFFDRTFNHDAVSEELSDGRWDGRLRMINAAGMTDHALARQTAEFAQPRRSRTWRTASAMSHSGDESALCLYYGMQLSKRLKSEGSDVTIGLVHAAVGGSEIGAWVDQNTLSLCDVAETPRTSTPVVPPSSLFNGVITPYVNMTITGWLWYQGENNVGNSTPEEYACLLRALIDLWRGLWSAAGAQTTGVSAPFGIVELAPGGSEGYGDRYPLFRATQVAVANDVDNAFVVITYDLPDPWGSLHCEAKRCCPFSNGTSQSNFVPADGCVTQAQCWDGKALDGDWGSNLPKQYMGPIHPRLKRRIGDRAALGALSALQMQGGGISAKFGSCTVEEQDTKVNFVLQLNSDEALQVIPEQKRVVHSSVLQVCLAPDTSEGKAVCQCKLLKEGTEGDWHCEYPEWDQTQSHSEESWHIVDLAQIQIDESNRLSFQIDESHGIKVWAIKFGWEDNCCMGDNRVIEGLAPCPPLACGIFSETGELPPQPFFLNVDTSSNVCGE